MAQPTNTFDTYDQVGIREDLQDVIYDISPDETPFLSKCAKVKAANRLHEWQTDALRTPGVNAHIEGDDTIAVARTPTVRLGNYTQIFKDAVTISGSDEGMSKAGRAQEMAYQIGRTAKTLKLDMELAMFANQARAGGSSAAARYLAGVPAWLTTNTTFQSGAAGADPTGDGTNARTDDGTPVAFTQTRFDSTMQAIWRSGGKPDTVYLNDFQMNKALGFVGNNNQRNTTDQGAIVNDVVLYRTPWGSVKWQLSRHVRARDVFIMQSDMWKIATLRPMKNEPLAKTGDSEKRQILTEVTLVSANEKASGAVYDNTTS